MFTGKRVRTPMKRNTSMTEFTLDFNAVNNQPLDPSTGASPWLHRGHSADMVETAHFLRVCSLCKTRLIPGRDIYMYRGDSAFCSEECRQRQMARDERKEKRPLPSKREAATAPAAAAQAFATAAV